jgi:hypothetical protein
MMDSTHCGGEYARTSTTLGGTGNNGGGTMDLEAPMMKSWNRDEVLFKRSSKMKEPTKQRSLNRITKEEGLCHGVEGEGDLPKRRRGVWVVT